MISWNVGGYRWQKSQRHQQRYKGAGSAYPSGPLPEALLGVGYQLEAFHLRDIAILVLASNGREPVDLEKRQY